MQLRELVNSIPSSPKKSKGFIARKNSPACASGAAS
jgi:hypothetical protein